MTRAAIILALALALGATACDMPPKTDCTRLSDGERFSGYSYTDIDTGRIAYTHIDIGGSNSYIVAVGNPHWSCKPRSRQP